MLFYPQTSLRVDCYINADFAGSFSVANKQDPLSVKSRTGYVIMHQGTPLLWASKMQTQIALSTMEAEYIALSQAMRDLIPIREVLKEIMTMVFRVKKTYPMSHIQNPSMTPTMMTKNTIFLHQQCLKTMMHV